ncbi:glycosyltransferase [Desulfoglaeba alkanexedens]|uniref:Glycosyltransferase n=1 Tax=Desulfoglaeba alkanexedens ALDC TaxID=980445 RepID=A0A4P8L340_9BACT|nr:glycosyltransferase [Desulfoglaeba alkanexedens]QCQ21182.1 glycosyltransferase [Desulfoglaeba alkanexedens ALDC]
MKEPQRRWRLALFLATSGHSGVDRIMKHFIAELGTRPLDVDLLQVEGHGPHMASLPPNVRRVPLGTRHVQSSVLRLAQYLRKVRPNALLCDKDRVNRTAVVSAVMAGYPGRLVLRVGTTVSKNLESRGFFHRSVQYWSIRRLYAKAQTVIVPSQGAARDLEAVGSFPPGFVRVLPSPVVSDALHRLARKPIAHPWLQKGEPPVILGAGELCERKDFGTLIRAFAQVVKIRPCRLVILGKGKKRAALEALARDLSISDKVSFPGFVENPYAYMAGSAVFVLSSTCEGLPVVLTEAMALGTPVVSTDCPSGPREILKDGRFGPLVPIRNPRMLAEAIATVLDTPPDADALKAAASRYHVRPATDAYLQVLGYDETPDPRAGSWDTPPRPMDGEAAGETP